MKGNANTFLLFVYGTLKRGGCRHGPLAAQRCRGAARTRPRYALYDLGAYPGLTADEETGQVVHGEVYEVEESLTPWLDTVEGAPDWFKREPIAVEGYLDTVWAYFYQGDAGGRPRVASGEWNIDRAGEDEA